MFIAAIVIYVILAIFFGPIWPIELLAGRGGLIGEIIAIGWGALLIIGLSNL